MSLSAVGADEAAHILNDSGDRHIHLPAEVDAFAAVGKRHLLGRCDNHRLFVSRNHLTGGKRLVPRSRREIEHQIIERAPLHILQQLFEHADLCGSAPDDRPVRILHHQTDGEDFDSVRLDREHAVLVSFDRCGLQTEQRRLRGSVEVDVEQSDLRALAGQCQRQRRRHGALSDPSLPRQHKQFVLNHRKTVLKFLFRIACGGTAGAVPGTGGAHDFPFR